MSSREGWPLRKPERDRTATPKPRACDAGPLDARGNTTSPLGHPVRGVALRPTQHNGQTGQRVAKETRRAQKRGGRCFLPDTPRTFTF